MSEPSCNHDTEPNPGAPSPKFCSECGKPLVYHPKESQEEKAKTPEQIEEEKLEEILEKIDKADDFLVNTWTGHLIIVIVVLSITAIVLSWIYD